MFIKSYLFLNFLFRYFPSLIVELKISHFNNVANFDDDIRALEADIYELLIPVL